MIHVQRSKAGVEVIIIIFIDVTSSVEECTRSGYFKHVYMYILLGFPQPIYNVL